MKIYVCFHRNTITVGIFYALPAFQLVLSEQQVCDRCQHQYHIYICRLYTRYSVILLRVTVVQWMERIKKENMYMYSCCVT